MPEREIIGTSIIRPNKVIACCSAAHASNGVARCLLLEAAGTGRRAENRLAQYRDISHIKARTSPLQGAITSDCQRAKLALYGYRLRHMLPGLYYRQPDDIEQIIRLIEIFYIADIAFSFDDNVGAHAAAKQCESALSPSRRENSISGLL